MVAPVELWDVAMRYRTVFGLLLVAAILAGDMHGQQTTRGREFYVAFLPNYHNGGDLAPDSLYLFIVADEPTNGTITYTNNLGRRSRAHSPSPIRNKFSCTVCSIAPMSCSATTTMGSLLHRTRTSRSVCVSFE